MCSNHQHDTDRLRPCVWFKCIDCVTKVVYTLFMYTTVSKGEHAAQCHVTYSGVRSSNMSCKTVWIQHYVTVSTLPCTSEASACMSHKGTSTLSLNYTGPHVCVFTQGQHYGKKVGQGMNCIVRQLSKCSEGSKYSVEVHHPRVCSAQRLLRTNVKVHLKQLLSHQTRWPYPGEKLSVVE